MKFKYTFLPCFLFLFFLIPITKAQSPWDLTLAYHGNNLWNPGLKLGAEYGLIDKTKTNKKEKSITKTIHLNGNLGFYIDPSSHTGIFSHYGFMFRRITQKGWHISLGVSPIGIFRSALPETYEVDFEGNVNRVSSPGRTYFSPTGSLGFGKFKQNSGQGWFTQANIMLLSPYNNAFIPFLNIEAGYRINLNNLSK